MVPLLEFACSFLICAAIIYLIVRFITWVGKTNRASDLKYHENRDPELDDLHTTARQVLRLVESEYLDSEAAKVVLDAVKQRRLQLLHPRPVPPRFAPPRRQSVVTRAEPELVQAVEVAEDLPVLQAAPTSPSPVIARQHENVPPPPRRRWTDVLTGFMEEKNILWGELVGGLLIVGCSIALVVSLWRTLEEELPFFPFVVFSTITLALFAAGEYTLHHWKLEATSRGLLIITSLLIPLNFLVLAGLMNGKEGGVVEVVVNVAALAVFVAVVRKGGEQLIAGGGWMMALAVVGASVPSLLLPWCDSSTVSSLPVLLGGLSVVCMTTGVAFRLRTAGDGEQPIRRRSASLLLFFGIAVFTSVAVLTFFASQATTGKVLHELSGPLSIVGVVGLLVGLITHRRLEGVDEGLVRVTATGTALAGGVVVLVAVILALPLPVMLAGVCLSVGFILSVLGFRLVLPLLHAFALPCLGLGLLSGLHLLTGRLDVGWHHVADVLLALASGDGGLVLAGLALLLVGIAEVLHRANRRDDAIAHAVGALVSGSVALVLAGYHGVADPARAAVVYLTLGVVLLASLVRWPVRSLAGPGYCLLLAGSLWLLYWVAPGPTEAWGLVLAVETLVLAILGLLHQKEENRQQVLTEPCRDLTVLAGVLTLVTVLLSRGFPNGWTHSLTALSLTISSLIWTRATRQVQGFWIAAALLWASLAHLLGYVLPHGMIAAPGRSGLLGAATLFLAARLLLSQERVSSSTRKWFAKPASGVASCMTLLALLVFLRFPGSLLLLGSHLVWIGGLWLVLAWSERSAVWLSAGQALLAVAVCVLSTVPFEGTTWAERIGNPLLWQSAGITLGIVNLLWVLVRGLLRSETARVLFDPPWPSVDTVFTAVLPVSFLLLGVAGCWVPGFAFADSGAGIFLGVVGLLLLATLADRDRQLAVPGLVVLGLSLPFLLVTRGLDPAPVIRWGMALVLLICSLPFWMGHPLTSRARRLGLPSVARWSVVLAQSILRCGSIGVIILFSVETLFSTSVELSLRALGSVVVPLAIASATMLGHALRERSSGLLFVAGLLVNLTVSLATWHLSAEVPLLHRWVPLIEANLVAAGFIALLWLAFQNRFVSCWPPRRWQLLLLEGQTGITGLGALVLLAAPFLWMVTRVGEALPEGLRRVGDWGGWLTWAVSFLACHVVCRRWRPTLTTHVLGLAGMGTGILGATRFVDPWPALLAGWSLLGIAWMGLLTVRLQRSEDAAGPRLWVEVMAFSLVLLGIRSGLGETHVPWTSAGPLFLAAILFGVMALQGRSSSRVWFSCLCMVASGVLGWLEWGEASLDQFGLVLACSLALSSLVWSPLCLRSRLSTRSSHTATGMGLALLGLVVVADWNLWTSGPTPLTGAAFVLVAAAVLVSLWDESASFTPYGVYVLGLVGVMLLLTVVRATGDQAVTVAALALTGHVLGAITVCRGLHGRSRIASKLGLASWVTNGPVRTWWVVSQAGLGTLVLLLNAYLTLGSDSPLHRLLGAGSSLLLLLAALHLGTVLTEPRERLFRQVALLMGPLVLAEFGFVGLEPVGDGIPLHHCALALFALVLCCVAYRELFPRWFGESGWVIDLRQAGGTLGMTALLTMGGVLLLEMFTFDPLTRRTPLSVFEVSLVTLALLGLFVLSLREGLKQPGRSVFVYGAEVLLTLLFVHLRWNIPVMRDMTSVKYWPIMVMALAFVGAALGELFRRRGLEELAIPLHRTGLALPILPLLAFFLRPTPEMLEFAGNIAPGLTVLLAPLQHLPSERSTQALLWFTTSVLLTGVAMARRSFAHSIAAALAANCGLWMLLAHHGVGLLLHPQLWLIPLALIVLVSEQLNRAGLNREQRLALRYLGLSLLYLSSTADLFINGIGDSVWLPLALAFASVMGVLTGILLRVRAFLFMGVLFLLVDVLSMIWHAAVDRTHTWVWYVSGIVLGGAILALFAVFEKRRADVLRLIDDLRRWD